MKLDVIKSLMSSEIIGFYVLFLILSTTIIYLTYRFWDVLIGRKD